MQLLSVFGHMMPLVIMLEHKIAILVIDLVLAVLWPESSFRLHLKEAVEGHLEDVVHIDHLLGIEQRWRAVGCINQQLAGIDHDVSLFGRKGHDRRMHVHGIGCEARLKSIFLHERRAEEHIIDQRILGELVDKQKRTRLKQQGIVSTKIVLRDIDGSPRRTSSEDSKNGTLDLTRIAAILVHNLATGITDKKIGRTIQQWDRGVLCRCILHILKIYAQRYKKKYTFLAYS